MKRRVIALFLAVMMLASMMAVTVYADGTPTIRVSDAGEAARGAEVSVTVSLENNPGIMCFSLTLTYDETRLSLVSLEKGALTEGELWTVNGARATWLATSDVNFNGVILTANFTVLDDAPLGDAAVTISYQPGDIGNYNEEEVNFEVAAGGVTVICNHVSDEGTVTTEATCTEPGVKTYTCTLCGEVIRTEEISAKGHSWDEGVVFAEPTCTEDGMKIYTCANCGETRTEAITAKGHTWGEWVLTSEPTLDADGVETRTCQVCGATETRPVAAVVYTVSYNANGGTGAPESQRKLQGTALTLSETVPTKDGFVFKGWAESEGATAAQYQPGGSFTKDADTTLYAVWEKDASCVGTITVGTIKRARPGTEVKISVELTENPGVAAMSLQLNYDTTKLKLTGYSDAGLTGWVINPETGGMVWADTQNTTITDTIVDLTFTVLEGAEDGFAEVTITDRMIVNDNEEVLEFAVISGGVNVANSIPGDVTGDGNVNIIDVLRLQKYLAGMDVEIDPIAADVTGDGNVNVIDVLRMKKFLAGMDVVLQ